jgi:flavin-dependent dehydrogenase
MEKSENTRLEDAMAQRYTDCEYDVIVVGAGFGGPVAAKLCAEAGLRTLMLERGERVGEKVISGLTIPFYGFLFGPQFIRDGNPPIERPADGIINYIVKDIESGDIDIEDSLRIPKPLSPVLAFGYNAYCQPFCEWEANRAVEAGVRLMTSTTVVSLLMEYGRVAGVVTETGDALRSRMVIDAEGAQGVLAVGAGIREKYPPEAISLADVYDYKMAKEDVDRVFGHTLRFCWGWDEQRLAPPLGYGNGLMVWPYRESLHFIQDQCLKTDRRHAAHIKDEFDEYHRNITSALPWWRDEVAPHIELRSRMWDAFEIYVGLDDELRSMPNHTDGMILIGDAAGLESTELCDGVPAAWFSAEIAAEVAVEAIRSGDTSATFLKRYDERIRAHPIIQWSISQTNRHDLRYAQAEHDEEKLKELIHDGWGLGGFTHISTPLARMILDSISEDPAIVKSWLRMFPRYYYNWRRQRFEGREANAVEVPFPTPKRTLAQTALNAALLVADRVIDFAGPLIGRLAALIAPLSRFANPLMKSALPLVEPAYLWSIGKMEWAMDPVSRAICDFIDRSDPTIFDPPGRDRRA